MQFDVTMRSALGDRLCDSKKDETGGCGQVSSEQHEVTIVPGYRKPWSPLGDHFSPLHEWSYKMLLLLCKGYKFWYCRQFFNVDKCLLVKSSDYC